MKSNCSFVIIHMICKYFLPFHRLPFQFCCFFCCAEGLALFVLAVPCGLWNLFPRPGIKSGSLEVTVPRPHCWTARESPVQKFFSLISLLMLEFVVCIFGVIHIQKSLPRPLSRSFSPMFSSRNFTVSGLRFKSLICLKLIYVNGVKTGVQSPFSACGYSFFPTPFVWRGTPFSFSRYYNTVISIQFTHPTKFLTFSNSQTLFKFPVVSQIS